MKAKSITIYLSHSLRNLGEHLNEGVWADNGLALCMRTLLQLLTLQYLFCWYPINENSFEFDPDSAAVVQIHVNILSVASAVDLRALMSNVSQLSSSIV